MIIFLVIIHELGHYLVNRYYGYKTSVKYSWTSITLGENLLNKEPIYVMVISWFMGILFGLIYLILIDAELIFIFAYLIACNIDIYGILSFLKYSIKRETRNKTQYEICKQELIDYNNKWGNIK